MEQRTYTYVHDKWLSAVLGQPTESSLHVLPERSQLHIINIKQIL